MLRSKTNSVKIGKNKFQPTKYDKDGNLYCAIYRKNCCKLTLLYKFKEETYNIIWVAEGWLTNRHKKLLKLFLKEFDWL